MSTDDWVPPDMFRDHVRQLICDTGLSWRLIAAHAGVAPRTLHALLHGRRPGVAVRSLHISVARALAATSVESIAEADTAPADAQAPRELLRALRGLGWHQEVLQAFLTSDDWCQLDDPQARSCSRATRIRVQACYDQLTGGSPPLQRSAPPRVQSSGRRGSYAGPARTRVGA